MDETDLQDLSNLPRDHEVLRWAATTFPTTSHMCCPDSLATFATTIQRECAETLKIRYSGKNDGLEEFLRILADTHFVPRAKLESIRQILAMKDSDHFSTLWHFTSARNLDSIRVLGLLSLAQVRSKGIEFVASSGETSQWWDHIIHHDRFVHLCLDRDHPMKWVAEKQRGIRDVVWIAVDPRIVDDRETWYSPTNAIKKRKPKKPDRSPRTALSGDSQAEVMVSDHIPVGYLTIPAK